MSTINERGPSQSTLDIPQPHYQQQQHHSTSSLEIPQITTIDHNGQQYDQQQQQQNDTPMMVGNGDQLQVPHEPSPFHASNERHVHYDANPKVFFLPPDKPSKVIVHHFSNSILSVLQCIFVPMITTYLIMLIPVGPISNGFLMNWVYNIVYIPAVALSTSIFHLGWAGAFIKDYKHISPIFIHTFLCSLTFSLICQLVNSRWYPIPGYILIIPILSLLVLPAIIYIRSKDRFTSKLNRPFGKYVLFIFLCLLVLAISMTFVILFSFPTYQLIVGVIYYLLMFLLCQGLVSITRNNTPKGTHNVICYWVETISELVMCYMFIRILPMTFYILLALKIIVLFRYPLFMTEKYWEWRTMIKQKLDKVDQEDWFNSTHLGDKIIYGFLGWFFPVSVERDEHKTRVVDRFFFTCLCYCGVPLFYMVFTIGIRWSHVSDYYAYSLLSENAYIWLLIYSLFSSFFTYMSFLVIRYMFQVYFHLSVINHPMISLKNNVRLMMYCNFSALLLPVTFMMMQNNVYFLVNR
ncbi:hypothetical protein SAMD00019534_018750 [Acytostelium subglobosum LB1]|uniref:hypothetical protein n=1 Tax=Acytostelium subglobosum LB1 TaxID=1410327 RepID=UPI000644F25F|nr:hypothetical protein SAMD00019534_018750 [Acytostelium subglobosum LB1]GAM18700.1 hypothetical protein SAMD00019534_018750 [Acytostelium subglobosum LB1]|eukprot:XP_012757920.1 hypothetical protein SAMD00019534_018750 [Acytostelium subglobosum LB1]